MSDAIKKLHDYLAKSPSVVYPEDVFAYLPAIEDENAKLREERDHWHVEQVHAYGNWEDAYKRAIELEKQNAKLRELVLCLLTCSSDTGDACDRCPVNGGAGIWDFEDFCDSLLDRVHELRIELNA